MRLSHDDERNGISGSIENQRIVLAKCVKVHHLTNTRFFYDDRYSQMTFTWTGSIKIMAMAGQMLIAPSLSKNIPGWAGTGLWLDNCWRKILSN